MRQAVCVRGCVLEDYSDAAALRGFFDGFFGLVTEFLAKKAFFVAVALQAATGRSQGGEGGYTRDPPAYRRGCGRGPRTIEGSITWMMNAGSREDDSVRDQGRK